MGSSVGGTHHPADHAHELGAFLLKLLAGGRGFGAGGLGFRASSCRGPAFTQRPAECTRVCHVDVGKGLYLAVCQRVTQGTQPHRLRRWFTMVLAVTEPSSFSFSQRRIRLCQSAALSFSLRPLPVTPLHFLLSHDWDWSGGRDKTGLGLYLCTTSIYYSITCVLLVYIIVVPSFKNQLKSHLFKKAYNI